MSTPVKRSNAKGVTVSILMDSFEFAFGNCLNIGSKSGYIGSLFENGGYVWTCDADDVTISSTDQLSLVVLSGIILRISGFSISAGNVGI